LITPSPNAYEVFSQDKQVLFSLHQSQLAVVSAQSKQLVVDVSGYKDLSLIHSLFAMHSP